MDDVTATQWVRGTIRAEMARRSMTYADLERELAARGVHDNERNLRNKVMRGTFSAAFFIQCLEAIGVGQLDIDVLELVTSVRSGTLSKERIQSSQLDVGARPGVNETIDEIRHVLECGETGTTDD